MKRLLRGPVLPLLALAVTAAIYFLAKAKIVSHDLSSNFMDVMILTLTAWVFWNMWEDHKERQPKEGSQP